MAGLVGFALLYLVFVVWWQGIQPSNERQWNPPVARLAYAEINNELVTVRNGQLYCFNIFATLDGEFLEKARDLLRQPGGSTA